MRFSSLLVSLSPWLLIFFLALALRLLVWHWREQYPLGGDEQEYFNQALTLLRERRYEELNLMRPPLYTFFLAGNIYLFDSLVQRLRLIQAIISALTIFPMHALTHHLFRDRRIALVAALLTALNYTLAANATELLTETLFLFGLTTVFWLLVKTTKDGGRRTGDDGRRTTDGGRRTTDSPFHPFTLSPFHLLIPSLAGLTLGALILVRSVALPLLPLGALWLMFQRQRPGDWEIGEHGDQEIGGHKDTARGGRGGPALQHLVPFHPFTLSPFHPFTRSFRWSASLAFVLCTLLVVLPWTTRNYMTYGALILVDTTGAENLWLDNDPAGREAVKRDLYALGEDQAARQRLAAERGAEAILADPGRFIAKAWGEAQTFFALQYFDDMRERREIWAPPLEVWLRLLLGDGLWLLLLLAGVFGLWFAVTEDGGRRTEDERRTTNDEQRTTNDEQSPYGRIAYAHNDDQRPTMDAPRATRHAPRATQDVTRATQDVTRMDIIQNLKSKIQNPKWMFVLWALYVFLTGLIFHVELRYRLPLYPVLLPYAAWTLTNVARFFARRQSPIAISNLQSPTPRLLGAGITIVALITLTLLHRPYLSEGWMLAQKHVALWQAEQALVWDAAVDAQTAAQRVLALDSGSALANVALARSYLLERDPSRALQALNVATSAIREHPYPHLLRGAILRAQGDTDAAREALAYERNSLEDLQRWAWRTFAPIAPAPEEIDIGGGLDLGFIQGFFHTEAGSFRWSTDNAQLKLAVPANAAQLDLRLASGRPPGVAPPTVVILLDGRELGRFQPDTDWQTYRVPITQSARMAVLTIRSDTFRPRAYDRASPDNRALGVMVDWVTLRERAP